MKVNIEIQLHKNEFIYKTQCLLMKRENKQVWQHYINICANLNKQMLMDYVLEYNKVMHVIQLQIEIMAYIEAPKRYVHY